MTVSVTASNVVGLKGEDFTPAGIELSVVELAREVLAQAERGELVGLAVVYVEANGRADTRWRCGHQRHSLLGATYYLQHDLAKG